MSKNYFRAIATMVGAIIGVGIFAIPYVVSQSGILMLFIFLPILGLAQYYIHRLYAEVILSTKTKHRVPGYVEKYYGEKHKKAALAVVLIGINLGILAYIIFGGNFLHQLMSPALGGSVFIYTTVLFVIEALIVLVGLRLIASVELVMATFLFLVVGLIIWRGWGDIDLANYHFINWESALLPYGPIFFAVGGSSAIPGVCKLLAHKKENIKSAIFWGTFIPIIVTLIFVVFIIGITGNNTSPDTLTGLSSVFGNGVVKIALIFGILSIFTSLLVTMQAAREIYWWDLGVSRKLAWFLAAVPPYLLYLIGFNNMTKVVGLTGAVLGGMIGIIYILLGLAVKGKREQESIIKNKINKAVAYALSIFFILGLIYEIWQMFSG